MVITKTMIAGLTLAGVMVLGGNTAFAKTNNQADSSTNPPALVAVEGVDLAYVAAHSTMGTATAVEGVTPTLPDGATGKTQANPNISAKDELTLVAVDGVDLASVAANSKMGTATAVEGVTPKLPDGGTGKTLSNPNMPVKP